MALQHGIVVSSDRSRLQLDTVHGWLRGTYWSPDIRRDITERAFANSFSVGAYRDDGVQVGVARAVSDGATFAWLCDVFVCEPHRRHRLARQMAEMLMALPDLATVRLWLLGTRDAHEVYRPLGFVETEADRFMAMRPSPTRWQATPS